MRVKTLLLTALAGLVLAAPLAAAAQSHGRGMQPAWAQAHRDFQRPDRPEREFVQQRILSIREVAEIVRGRYGGEMLGGSLEGGDRPFYVLQWRMPDGDRRDIRVDAVSGSILG